MIHIPCKAQRVRHDPEDLGGAGVCGKGSPGEEVRAKAVKYLSDEGNSSKLGGIL